VLLAAEWVFRHPHHLRAYTPLLTNPFYGTRVQLLEHGEKLPLMTD